MQPILPSGFCLTSDGLTGLDGPFGSIFFLPAASAPSVDVLDNSWCRKSETNHAKTQKLHHIQLNRIPIRRCKELESQHQAACFNALK